MTILFWVPYPSEGASNRYRVEQFLPFLLEKGDRYTLSPFWNKSAFAILYKNGYHFRKAWYCFLGTVRRLAELCTIWRYDVVFIHRQSHPIAGAFFETVLSALNKPYIFDFDDAIYVPASSLPNNFVERFRKPRHIEHIIRMSALTIAGNKYLASYARKFNLAVTIIPTCIDTALYRPLLATQKTLITIGWIGSLTTVEFIASIHSSLTTISARYPQVRFMVVGGEYPVQGLSNVCSVPWKMEEELTCLTKFDIGIMPMPETPWTEGKCGFKAILYMGMGIPCVCSPVGVNKEIIDDGVNGFLASSKKEWEEKLARLIEDSSLRKKIGCAARKTIEEKYSLRALAPIFHQALIDACGKEKI